MNKVLDKQSHIPMYVQIEEALKPFKGRLIMTSSRSYFSAAISTGQTAATKS
ncbi:MAG TPA: hypothetical protein VLQ20_05265 [Planococcus sp. (in: firmicutes)]|nr:hypothetical protein [Planococcus sp. (in: firmicutes)]